MDDDQDGKRDVTVVLHAIMAFGVFAITIGCLAFIVPALFNRHDTASDLLAVALTIGAGAYAYLASRYVYRSFRITTNGEKK